MSLNTLIIVVIFVIIISLPALKKMFKNIRIDNSSNIHTACLYGDLRKIREFLNSGININSKDFGNKTPLMYAAEDGATEIIDYLLKNGANINDIDIRGDSSLIIALKNNNIIVKVGDKVKRGDKIGVMGNTGYSKGTHLHYEVMINKEKVEPFKYTYATNEHIVGSGTKSKYNILYLREDIKEMEEVKDNKSDNTPSDDVKEDNVIFEYVVPKDGIYKIRLNQNEKLVIKD